MIPVEPEGDPSATLQGLRRLDWPRASLESIVVRGRQPSRQRNLAAKAARGEWLLFLDSDSLPDSALIQRLLEGAARFGADAAGGPNLAPLGESGLSRAFSAVLASYFGSMSARARYAQVGAARLSSEKELILCNMLIRKSSFLGLGGFREDLYPNEENEFLNRLQREGGKVAYIPDAIVRRPRRDSVAAFARQAFNYGRGRMRQVRVNFFAGDLVNLLPLAALAYGAALPLLFSKSPLALAPLLAYLAADLAASLELLARGYGASAALGGVLLFPLRHASYGIGLLAGLMGRQAPPEGRGDITLQRPR